MSIKLFENYSAKVIIGNEEYKLSSLNIESLANNIFKFKFSATLVNVDIEFVVPVEEEFLEFNIKRDNLEEFDKNDEWWLIKYGYARKVKRLSSFKIKVNSDLELKGHSNNYVEGYRRVT